MPHSKITKITMNNTNGARRKGKKRRYMHISIIERGERERYITEKEKSSVTRKGRQG